MINEIPLYSYSWSRAARCVKQMFFLFTAILMLLCAGAQPAWAAAAATTTTLSVTSGSSAVTSVAAKTVVTLTATVKAGSAAVKTGQVNFCDATAKYCTDIHLLGTAQLTSAGTAMVKFRPGTGSHSYKAVFLGTNSDASSSSSDSALTVTGKYPTVTTLAPSGSAGGYTLTATVTGYMNNGKLASPTGTVTFLDTSNGNSVLRTAALGTGMPGVDWFNSQTPATDSPNSIAVGDFNGDGKTDLAVANNLGYFAPGRVTILLGNGDGTFTATAASPGTGIAPASIIVGDFNGDGKADLAVANNGDNTVTILLGNGDGTFTQTTVSPAAGDGPASLAVGDFNGDGKADLAVANQIGFESGMVTVLLGNGDGTFAATAASPATEGWPTSVAVGDFNADGKADLAVGVGNNTVTILLGNGDGTFTAAAASPATGSDPQSIAVGDFNGDGKADLAVANEDGTVTVLLGNGNGTFTATAASPEAGIIPSSIAVGDFNGDGKADLAVANDDDTVTVLLGNGDGTFTATEASPATGWRSISVAVGDFNGDGISDLATANDEGTVTALLTQLTQTATATVSGIALPLNTGTHQVEASYPGDNNYGTSVGTTPLVAPTPLVSPSATSLPFGGWLVGSSTGSQNVTLTNTGNTTLAVSSIQVTGTNAASFSASNNCGTGIAAGASCTITVQFAPQALGALNASVTITDNAIGSPQLISLAGTGLASPVALSANSLSFGSEPVGESSGVTDVTLTNLSGATLPIKSIKLTGANTTSFVSSNDCGAGVAARASCWIAVRFVPTVGGALTAAITLTDNASDSPQSITLKGTGIIAPAASISLSAQSLSIGFEPVGESSVVRDVTVTNTSTATVYFASIKLTGADATSFVSSNSCGAGIAAGASCWIAVRFVPTVGGALTGAIILTDNATGSPQSIALSGTASN